MYKIISQEERFAAVEEVWPPPALNVSSSLLILLQEISRHGRQFVGPFCGPELTSLRTSGLSAKLVTPGTQRDQCALREGHRQGEKGAVPSSHFRLTLKGEKFLSLPEDELRKVATATAVTLAALLKLYAEALPTGNLTGVHSRGWAVESRLTSTGQVIVDLLLSDDQTLSRGSETAPARKTQ